MNNLYELGFTERLNLYVNENNLNTYEIGRIISEQKEKFTVVTSDQEYSAEITGSMRFLARDREDLPAVGDWVAISPQEYGFAIIHAIIPRSTCIKRKSISHFGQVQIIASNIDYALIIQAVDRDFNINRLERYLTVCNDSGVVPLIILNKIDLIHEVALKEIVESIKNRIRDVPIVTISNETKAGYEVLKKFIEKGKTYCLLGSSGVGKSTLVNALSNEKIMETDDISAHTSKGRHITSYRELVVLGSGGIIIDNPGMREIGITDGAEGLETTFDIISELAHYCKFKNCTHTSEKGCAVVEGVESGKVDKALYENYMKLEKEREYFSSTVAEIRQKDKAFGKMMKNYHKGKSKHEY